MGGGLKAQANSLALATGETTAQLVTLGLILATTLAAVLGAASRAILSAHDGAAYYAFTGLAALGAALALHFAGIGVQGVVLFDAASSFAYLFTPRAVARPGAC